MTAPGTWWGVVLCRRALEDPELSDADLATLLALTYVLDVHEAAPLPDQVPGTSRNLATPEARARIDRLVQRGYLERRRTAAGPRYRLYWSRLETRIAPRSGA